MQRVRWLGVLVAALLGSACDGGSAPHSAQLPPGPQASAPELAAYLAPRIGGRVLSKLDVRAERVLVGLGVPREPRADSEQRRVFELALWNATSDALEFVRLNVRAAALADDAVFAVTSDAALVRIDRDGHETRLIDRAQGKPALLAGGSVAVTRSGAEPGETDVWLCEPNGHAHAIAAAPGPDDLPMALTDGRLAFVSGRSGVASIWIAHPLTGSAEQLTNRGLVAGEPFDGFVPPPVELLAIEAQELRYDAGDRELWRVDLATGVGSKIGGSAR